MNNRIRQFMDYKGLSSSELADSIGVQRSNVTHVLQGRNKPGFLFISKLLETYPDVNAKWLITGQGNMVVGEPETHTDLFTTAQAQVEKEAEPVVTTTKSTNEEPVALINNVKTDSDLVNTIVASNTQEIERIVIFYTDQTFKQYLPSK